MGDTWDDGLTPGLSWDLGSTVASTVDPWIGSLAVPLGPFRTVGIQGQPTADPKREYISDYGYASQRNGDYFPLSSSIDDVTAQFGIGFYSTMLLDPKLGGSLYCLIDSILADGVEILEPRPRYDEDYSPTKEQSAPADLALGYEVAEFCRRALQRLDRPVDETLYDLYHAIAEGNALAEIVWESPTSGPDKNKLTLKALKPKHKHLWQFVVDRYWNLVGVLGFNAQRKDDPEPTDPLGDQPGYRFLKREHFALMCWKPRNCDPRGTSELRGAFTAWNMKFQMMPDYLDYLRRFASDSLVGTTAENASTSAGMSGSDESPEEKMYSQLAKFKNGTIMVVPYGASVTPLGVVGDGMAFLNAIKELDRQMVYALLHQTRATQESEYGSRADSQTGQDVMGLAVRMGRRVGCAMIENDVLFPLVRANYGEDVAHRWTPFISLGDTEHQDFSQNANAISNMFKDNMIAPAQLPELFEFLGLPVPTQADITWITEKLKPIAPVVSPVDPNNPPTPGPTPPVQKAKQRNLRVTPPRRNPPAE